MFKFYLKKLQNNIETIFSVILVLTCIYNYTNAPKIVCSLVKCNDSVTIVVKAMFPRSIAIACMMSKITTICKYLYDFPTYKKKIEQYELYFPMNVSKRKINRFFAIIMVFAYIIMIIPINIFRIYLIFRNIRDYNTLLFYILMYIQNLSMCLTEINFIVHCFGLYQKLQLINEDITMLKSEIIIKNKYPTVLQTKDRSICDFYTTCNNISSPLQNNELSLANSIEILKMRHQCVRNTVIDLNNLYGIQLGVSLCVLFKMALFDIHGEIVGGNTKTRSSILIYGWLLQYSFRFCAIVLTSHITTKQVLKIIQCY